MSHHVVNSSISTIESTTPMIKGPPSWRRWPRWKLWCLVALTIIIIVVIALAASLTDNSSQDPQLRSLGTGATIVLSNDLESYDSAEALLVLGVPRTQPQAVQRCQEINEHLASSPPQSYAKLLPRILRNTSSDQLFWVKGGDGTSCQAVDQLGVLSLIKCEQTLPALCTQSAPAANAKAQDTSPSWHIELEAGHDQKITGYRDRRSFRFMGIPFAEPLHRWTHSKPLESTGRIEALYRGARCKQDNQISSEDCLFLNVYTPYLPSPDLIPASSRLKPVMVFIHGGSLTSGDGSDSFADGGNLASRGDVVVVTINYRVGVFGFLALDDGDTNGNYGLGDQITALRWIRSNIEHFGGDRDRITLFGQSAGASSIRALLTSKSTQGMMAGAIMSSGPGGRGMGGPYSDYLTIPEVMEYINPVLEATGCRSKGRPIECLKGLSSDRLVSDGSNRMMIDGVNQAFFVEDGEILSSSHLRLNATGSNSAIPVVLGTMRDDAAYFLPKPERLELDLALLAAPISLADETAQALVKHTEDTGLGVRLPASDPNLSEPQAAFAVYNVTNHIGTLGIFACNTHATAYEATLHSAFNKTYTYQMHRAFADFPDLPICMAPIKPGYPDGDPYTGLQCHTGENAYVFGNPKYLRYNIRDKYDYPFARQMLDSWASFARTGDPNPEPEWMSMMGYSLDYGLQNVGPWLPTVANNPTLRRLGPIGSEMIPFGHDDNDDQFCKLMGLPLDLYAH